MVYQLNSFDIPYNINRINSLLYHFDNFNNKINEKTKLLKYGSVIELIIINNLAYMSDIVLRFFNFMIFLNLAFYKYN